MWFAAAIVSTVLITLASIFAFYRVFLYKPAPPFSPPPGQIQTARQESKTEGNGSNQNTPPAPSSPSASATPASSKKPKPSSTPRAMIGSIRIIQNNTAQTTTQGSNSTISGLIDMSGTPPSGSSIIIAARKAGSNSDFSTVVDSVKPQDSENWSWTSATTGTSYEMIAVLKGKSGTEDVDYAKSQTYTLKAPFSGQIFQVDLGYTLAAPTGTITVSCNTHYSNNTWAAVVTFPEVSGAKKYWLQIGTTSGNNDVADIAKSTQTQEATFNDSVNYYAQYAVSSVSNPTAVQYSSFSSPQTIHCP
jgi:hypothetical protein